MKNCRKGVPKLDNHTNEIFSMENLQVIYSYQHPYKELALQDGGAACVRTVFENITMEDIFTIVRNDRDLEEAVIRGLYDFWEHSYD